MEMLVICRVKSDFEFSFFSRIFSLSEMEMVARAPSFWKWFALVLALVAVLSSLRILIFSFQDYKSLKQPLLETLKNVNDFSTTDEEDETCTSSDDKEDDYETSQSLNRRREFIDFEEFRVSGSSIKPNLILRRRCGGFGGGQFSMSDLVSGKNVVKLWDGLGLGFDIETYYSAGLTLIWDVNRGFTVPAITASSPAVMVAAEDEIKNLSLGVWDRRIGHRRPEIYAEWKPDSDGIEKVYVGDEFCGGLMIGDLRNVRSPLGKVTESDDGDTWWDAVVVPSEDVNVSASDNCCDSVMTRLGDVGFFLPVFERAKWSNE